MLHLYNTYARLLCAHITSAAAFIDVCRFIFGSPTVLGVSGPDDMATAFIKWLHGPVAEYLVKNSEAKTLLGMVCGGKTGGALPEGVSKLKHVTLAVLSQECSRAAPGKKSSIG